jgi:hypothetical protein
LGDGVMVDGTSEVGLGLYVTRSRYMLAFFLFHVSFVVGWLVVCYIEGINRYVVDIFIPISLHRGLGINRCQIQ